MANQSVLVCFGMSADSGGGSLCNNQQWVSTYVVTPDQAAQLELLTTGGFDTNSFSLFFSGTLLLFATGFAVGIIISQLRKIRRG